MQVREQVDLRPLNTLALPARARYFCAVEDVETLRAAIAWARARQLPLLVLGGGSNVVLAGDWPGLVLAIALRGRRVEHCGGGARVTVGAGENWHALVQWCLQQQLYGLENLTLIPGTAGAAPIQNIGAYGVELADSLDVVRGWSLDDDCERELSAAQCQLGYRDSIFKGALRGRFIVTEIVLRLATTFAPVLAYPALHAALAGTVAPTAAQVERAVREIRQSRLPDPEQLPNAGSFFKNPVIAAAQFETLRSAHPQIPHYAAADGVKIPAAWLVEQCGWKGRRVGRVGVHAQQALVLVHYADSGITAGKADGGDDHLRNGNAAATVVNAGAELLALAAAITAAVHTRFGIALELEPTVYGAR